MDSPDLGKGDPFKEQQLQTVVFLYAMDWV